MSGSSLCRPPAPISSQPVGAQQQAGPSTRRLHLQHLAALPTTQAACPTRLAPLLGLAAVAAVAAAPPPTLARPAAADRLV